MNEQNENNFIIGFKAKLETIKNKDYLIQNEINQIVLFTSTDGRNSPFLIDELNFANETNSVFNLMELGNRDFFNSIFNDFLINGEITVLPDSTEGDDDFLSVRDDEYLMSEAEQACDFAKYYMWLQELQQKPNLKKPNQKTSLTHKQKMLALYYLGIDMRKFGNNLQSAKILSSILGLDESNTKEYLTYFDGKNCKVKTNPNIKKVLELFEHEDFNKIYNTINQDLEK